MMHSHLVTSIAGMGFVILILALIVVVIVSLIRVWQTKVQTTKEELYQKLALDATEAQKENVRQQEKLIEELTEVKERLASIERILKEVE